MVRGTFANVRLRNLLVPGREGPWTVHLPSGEAMSIFTAAERYRKSATPLVVLAGREYGAGSSRDWAAKGPRLLGVRAVIAESFERIHRSNLIGMGIVPLEFTDGASAASLGLTGTETFAITGLAGGEVRDAAATADSENGTTRRFSVRARIDTPREYAYLRHGGILPYALRRLLGRT
jgi:aconitate hydratase